MITFMLYSMCKYPDYLEPLRKEAKENSEQGLYGSNPDDTPVMDSFLKESARLNPLRTGKLCLMIRCKRRQPFPFADGSIVTMDRKVISPNVRLQDGTRVPQGNFMVVAQALVMRDQANFIQPDEFNPARFLTTENHTVKSRSRFTHPSNEYLFWGTASRPW